MFWAIFLVTWGGAIHRIIKNIVIAFLNPVLKLLTPQCIQTTTYKSSRWPQSLLGQLKTGCKTSFHYLQFTSCIYNYVFCNLICDLKSEISPALCDNKCCSENQTFFVRVESPGTRLVRSLVTWLDQTAKEQIHVWWQKRLGVGMRLPIRMQQISYLKVVKLYIASVWDLGL